jgi:hypothetical protein
MLSTVTVSVTAKNNKAGPRVLVTGIIFCSLFIFTNYGTRLSCGDCVSPQDRFDDEAMRLVGATSGVR